MLLLHFYYWYHISFLEESKFYLNLSYSLIPRIKLVAMTS